MLNVRGTWQHQRLILHCTDDATLQYQTEFVFHSEQRNFQFSEVPFKAWKDAL